VKAKGEAELLAEQLAWLQQVLDKANDRRRLRLVLEDFLGKIKKI
jgi:hypothetical protein